MGLIGFMASGLLVLGIYQGLRAWACKDFQVVATQRFVDSSGFFAGGKQKSGENQKRSRLHANSFRRRGAWTAMQTWAAAFLSRFAP
jgi:hypothetical protein